MKAEKLIKVSEETKKTLDDLKIHPRETYDDVVQRLLPKKEKAEPHHVVSHSANGEGMQE